jgi:hypothetical protein
MRGAFASSRHRRNDRHRARSVPMSDSPKVDVANKETTPTDLRAKERRRSDATRGPWWHSTCDCAIRRNPRRSISLRDTRGRPLFSLHVSLQCGRKQG